MTCVTCLANRSLCLKLQSFPIRTSLDQIINKIFPLSCSALASTNIWRNCSPLPWNFTRTSSLSGCPPVSPLPWSLLIPQWRHTHQPPSTILSTPGCIFFLLPGRELQVSVYLMVQEFAAKPQHEKERQETDVIRDKKRAPGRERLCFEAELLIDLCDCAWRYSHDNDSDAVWITCLCIVLAITGKFFILFLRIL